MTKRPHRVTLLDEMTDAERKAVPLASLLDYFPDALIEAARVIADGQRQHGTQGWDRSKSNDHRNSLIRHLVQWGEKDKDGRPHTAKVVIRSLMALQIDLEQERAEKARLQRRKRRAAAVARRKR